VRLTKPQRDLVKAAQNSRVFLSGPAGTGKTTAAVRRTLSLLAAGVPGNQLLVLTPQRTLQEPYLKALHGPERGPGGEPALVTLGGLARRMCDLFWPITAQAAGFAYPERAPVFLTIETAQYHMARLVRPLLDQGFFDSVTIDRNRLYSQILDDLNKSAGVGFPHTEIGARLDAAWYGDPAQRRIYADAQECASRFRAYCLEHNLLDFSLQLELFRKVLWRTPECRDYLKREYRHLVYDNLEEDVPVAHDLLQEWLPDFDSALLIYDTGGGYRRFLGADPESALRLADLCETRLEFTESFVTSPPVADLEAALVEKLLPASAGLSDSTEKEEGRSKKWEPALSLSTAKFFPQMLDSVVNEIHILTSDFSIPYSEIVVLAPYLSDALRFSLAARLEALGIPWRSQRPSRSLRDEPASQCLLTLAELAHPQWGLFPAKFDVVYALMQAIQGLDLVRAQLLAEIVYRPRDGSLSSFGRIKSDVQERITFVFGQHFELLRSWLEDYRSRQLEPLDHFLRRLFGEVLSQKGFGFHRDYDSARVAASLIESVQKFRWAMEAAEEGLNRLEVGKEYLRTVQDGVIAAQYLESWQSEGKDAVLLSPAHTFLMMNRPATIQFWLDAGSSGWWERLFQPLTQPYVLSRAWMEGEQAGRLWTDADEVRANSETLVRLVTGLLRRCRQRVYLSISDLGESGFEQRGPLLKAVWRMQMERQTADGRA
jgi:superfamily I DNA/RNA helicase